MAKCDGPSVLKAPAKPTAKSTATTTAQSQSSHPQSLASESSKSTPKDPLVKGGKGKWAQKKVLSASLNSLLVIGQSKASAGSVAKNGNYDGSHDSFHSSTDSRSVALSHNA